MKQSATDIDHAIAVLTAANHAQRAYHERTAERSSSPYATVLLSTANRKDVEIEHSIKTLQEFARGEYGDYLVVHTIAPEDVPSSSISKLFWVVLALALAILGSIGYTEGMMLKECIEDGTTRMMGHLVQCQDLGHDPGVPSGQ